MLGYFACWVILHAFLSSAAFFQTQLFLSILSGIPSECQIVWIQVRPNILSGLIWVQSVCKSYQQTTLVGKIISGILSECQIVSIQVRLHILSGLIWVQTVCKSYQQTTLVGKKLTLILFCLFDLILYVPSTIFQL